MKQDVGKVENSMSVHERDYEYLEGSIGDFASNTEKRLDILAKGGRRIESDLKYLAAERKKAARATPEVKKLKKVFLVVVIVAVFIFIVSPFILTKDTGVNPAAPVEDKPDLSVD